MTVYLVDANNPTGYAQVLEEKDESGTVTKTYTLGLDVIAQQAPSIESGDTLYLLRDGHGSTRGLVDATGAPLVGQVFRYDAFGNRLDASDAKTSILYSGEQTDRWTGLQYLRARYYDPRTGRLNQLDPITGGPQDPQTLHKYLYCHADPINFTDPSGQMEFCFAGLLTSINISSSLRQQNSAASYAGLNYTTQFVNTVQSFQKVLTIVDRISDSFRVVMDVIKLLTLSPADLAEWVMKAGAIRGVMTAAAAGQRLFPYMVVNFKVPDAILKRLGPITQIAAISDRMQEILGEIGTGILLQALGFEHAMINLDAAGHGPDVVAQESITGLWGIFESKGGRSRLGKGVQGVGPQMSGPWIGYYLRNFIRDNQNPDGRALERAYRGEVPMIAVITRLNLALKRDQVKIGAQIFLPPNSIAHPWKGF